MLNVMMIAAFINLTQLSYSNNDYAPYREAAKAAVWAAYGICYRVRSYYDVSRCWGHLKTKINIQCNLSENNAFDKCSEKTISIMRKTPLRPDDAYLICSTHGANDKIRDCADYLSGRN